MNLVHLCNSVWKRYSLLRAYENEFLRGVLLRGVGIDLGAKSVDAKYYDYLNTEHVQRLDFVDFFHGGPGVIKMDLEEPFPIQDGAYDFVMSFNVMEHLFNYERFLDESCRILRSGGKLHGIVPLMWHFHPDPNDYYRFTGEALKRMLLARGLRDLVVVPLAHGPFKVAASQIGHVFKARPVRLLVYLCGIAADRLLSAFSTRTEQYAMAYYFRATK